MDAVPLTCRLNVRLTDAEDAEVRSAAEAAGLSISDYARRRILSRPVANATDATTRAELARMGSLIKRVAAGGEAGAAALAELAEAARRIGRSP